LTKFVIFFAINCHFPGNLDPVHLLMWKTWKKGFCGYRG